MTRFIALVVALGGFFLELGRALGRKQAQDEAKDIHDQRVAEANAARADADALGGVSDDPFNRDNR